MGPFDSVDFLHLLFIPFQKSRDDHLWRGILPRADSWGIKCEKLYGYPSIPQCILSWSTPSLVLSTIPAHFLDKRSSRANKKGTLGIIEKKAFTAQLVKWTLCMSARKELSGTSSAGSRSSAGPMDIASSSLANSSKIAKLVVFASSPPGNQNGFV